MVTDIKSKCAHCEKPTDTILVDESNGTSLAFCSWFCLVKWAIAHKDIRDISASFTRGDYRKTVEACPKIIEMHNIGKSNRAIAEEIGVSLNTVKSILNPTAKINSLGATSKILRLLISCSNEAILKVDNDIKHLLSEYPDDKEDIYGECYCESVSPEKLTAVLNSWLDKLDLCEDTPHSRGATIALTQVAQYITHLGVIGDKAFKD